MISTNQLELFSTVPTTVPTTVLYWFLGADGPRTKLLKLTESFSNSETFSNKSVNVSILRIFQLPEILLLVPCFLRSTRLLTGWLRQILRIHWVVHA